MEDGDDADEGGQRVFRHFGIEHGQAEGVVDGMLSDLCFVNLRIVVQWICLGILVLYYRIHYPY